MAAVSGSFGAGHRVPVVTYRCLPGQGAANAAVLDRIGWVPWLRGRAGLAGGLRTALLAVAA